jgi:hypothetical protein
MKSERCKYLPNCKGRAVERLGNVPICSGCQALRRLLAREAAKKFAAASSTKIEPAIIEVPKETPVEVPC